MTYEGIHSILADLLAVRRTEHRKSLNRVNLRHPEGYANPFKNIVKINISIEKCAADGPHSRRSPGLRQGPGSSDLHFLGLNLKVVGKQYPA